MYKELEFQKLKFKKPVFQKLEFQKSGRLQNISQTVHVLPNSGMSSFWPIFTFSIHIYIYQIALILMFLLFVSPLT